MDQLKAGQPASQTVYLNYDGGYSAEHLVPSDEAKGRGMVLVVEGDEVTQAQVDLFAAAAARAAAREEAAADAVKAGKKDKDETPAS